MYQSLKKFLKTPRLSQSMSSISNMISKFYYLLRFKLDLLGYKMGFVKKLTVVIIVQAPQSWSNVESTYHELKKRGHSVKVLSLPFLHHRSKSEDSKEYLLNKGISVFGPDELDIKQYPPNVILLTSPYDSTRPEEYSFDNLYKLNCMLVYIPYGLEIGGGPENLRYQFDLDTQNRSDLVVARSQRHFEMFRKYGRNQAKNVRVVGHPRFDLHLQPTQTPPDLIKFKNGKKLLLWCSHFDTEPNSWSTFLTIGQEILAHFKDENLPYKIIFRPHPLLIDDLKTKYNFEISDKTTYVKLSESLLLDISINHLPGLLLSDAIITDAGSFLLEYLATGRPIAFTKNLTGPELNDDGDLEKYVHTATNFSDVEKFLEDFKSNIDPLATSRQEVIPDFLYGLDGQVAKRIVDCIETPMFTRREPTI